MSILDENEFPPRRHSAPPVPLGGPPTMDNFMDNLREILKEEEDL
eukprot:CAMPEP_0180793978 /NCGR_PEP_ID=MMETSP1038_2-20121128/55329_1 /TAXON_ID=632150 /ORGANISM="Azadinium spinosum, Strain 3D9" /LENGTH=44 /DNA_ID= /DNA_START= /DNA_END= /DNA_ORIENTATION=